MQPRGHPQVLSTRRLAQSDRASHQAPASRGAAPLSSSKVSLPPRESLIVSVRRNDATSVPPSNTRHAAQSQPQPAKKGHKINVTVSRSPPRSPSRQQQQQPSRQLGVEGNYGERGRGGLPSSALTTPEIRDRFVSPNAVTVAVPSPPPPAQNAYPPSPAPTTPTFHSQNEQPAPLHPALSSDAYFPSQCPLMPPSEPPARPRRSCLSLSERSAHHPPYAPPPPPPVRGSVPPPPASSASAVFQSISGSQRGRPASPMHPKHWRNPPAAAPPADTVISLMDSPTINAGVREACVLEPDTALRSPPSPRSPRRPSPRRSFEMAVGAEGEAMAESPVSRHRMMDTRDDPPYRYAHSLYPHANDVTVTLPHTPEHPTMYGWPSENRSPSPAPVLRVPVVSSSPSVLYPDGTPIFIPPPRRPTSPRNKAALRVPTVITQHDRPPSPRPSHQARSPLAAWPSAQTQSPPKETTITARISANVPPAVPSARRCPGASLASPPPTYRVLTPPVQSARLQAPQPSHITYAPGYQITPRQVSYALPPPTYQYASPPLAAGTTYQGLPALTTRLDGQTVLGPGHPAAYLLDVFLSTNSRRMADTCRRLKRAALAEAFEELAFHARVSEFRDRHGRRMASLSKALESAELRAERAEQLVASRHAQKRREWFALGMASSAVSRLDADFADQMASTRRHYGERVTELRGNMRRLMGEAGAMQGSVRLDRSARRMGRVAKWEALTRWRDFSDRNSEKMRDVRAAVERYLGPVLKRGPDGQVEPGQPPSGFPEGSWQLRLFDQTCGALKSEEKLQALVRVLNGLKLRKQRGALDARKKRELGASSIASTLRTASQRNLLAALLHLQHFAWAIRDLLNPSGWRGGVASEHLQPASGRRAGSISNLSPGVTGEAVQRHVTGTGEVFRSGLTITPDVPILGKNTGEQADGSSGQLDLPNRRDSPSPPPVTSETPSKAARAFKLHGASSESGRQPQSPPPEGAGGYVSPLADPLGGTLLMMHPSREDRETTPNARGLTGQPVTEDIAAAHARAAISPATVVQSASFPPQFFPQQHQNPNNNQFVQTGGGVPLSVARHPELYMSPGKHFDKSPIVKSVSHASSHSPPPTTTGLLSPAYHSPNRTHPASFLPLPAASPQSIVIHPSIDPRTGMLTVTAHPSRAPPPPPVSQYERDDADTAGAPDAFARLTNWPGRPPMDPHANSIPPRNAPNQNTSLPSPYQTTAQKPDGGYSAHAPSTAQIPTITLNAPPAPPPRNEAAQVPTYQRQEPPTAPPPRQEPPPPQPPMQKSSEETATRSLPPQLALSQEELQRLAPRVALLFELWGTSAAGDACILLGEVWVTLAGVQKHFIRGTPAGLPRLLHMLIKAPEANTITAGDGRKETAMSLFPPHPALSGRLPLQGGELAVEINWVELTPRQRMSFKLLRAYSSQKKDAPSSGEAHAGAAQQPPPHVKNISVNVWAQRRGGPGGPVGPFEQVFASRAGGEMVWTSDGSGGGRYESTLPAWDETFEVEFECVKQGGQEGGK